MLAKWKRENQKDSGEEDNAELLEDKEPKRSSKAPEDIEEQPAEAKDDDATSDLSVRLKQFISSPVCERWNTERDGEDVVEMLLEAAEEVIAKNISMKSWITDALKVMGQS